MRSEPTHVRGLVLTVLGVIVLSPDALLVRLIGADTWTLLWWRGLLMGVALTLYLSARTPGGVAGGVRALGAVGFLSVPLFAGTVILFVVSLALTQAANTLLILSTAPLFAAVFGRVVLGEAVPRRTWMAIAAGISGTVVIVAGSLGGGAVWGDLCAVGSAACIAGHFVVARHRRAVSIVPAVALSGFLICAVATAGAAPMAVTGVDLALLAVLGLVVVPVSHVLITEGPRYLPAAEVGLILLLETVLGPVWVWWALGEVLAAATVLGGAVILGALVAHSAAGLRRAAGGPQRSQPWT